MKLFDDIARFDIDVPLYRETNYNYLNRSARPIAYMIREFIDNWFSHYPENLGEELKQRFCSNNNSQYDGAFFELFLHELLHRLGYQCMLHPQLPSNNSKRPDFQLTIGDSKLYIEATIAREESDAEIAAQSRMNDILEAIEQNLHSPNFFININIRSKPETSIPVTKIIAFLEKKLCSVDPEELTEVLVKEPQVRNLPHWVYRYQGWDIEFFPIPRNKPGLRNIGICTGGFEKVKTSEAIRRAVVKKAGRYGELEWPFIIAVNALGDPQHSHIIEALFGDEMINVTFTDTKPRSITNIESSRSLNGAWVSESKPRYTRVSAVLIAFRLSPWNVPDTKLCLYHNPWAKRPINGLLSEIDQVIPNNGQMEHIEGISLQKLMNLPSEWLKE